MSTDITTTSTSTSLVKRAGLLALFAVLALLMGAKFSGALISGPASSGHQSSAAYYYGVQSSLGQPTGVSIITSSATTGSVTVGWTNPVSSGVPITSYTVTDASGNQVLCTQTVVGALGASNTCTWTPTGSAKYSGNIRVYANAAGYTSAADTTGGVLFDLIAQPAQPTAAASALGVTVTFTPITTGASGGTAALVPTGYVVLTNNTIVCTAAASASTCSFSPTTAGLNAGQNYLFSVEAVNAAGYSQPSVNSASTLVLGTPAAVTNVVAAVNYAKGTVDLTYTASASNGGASLTTTYIVNGASVPCGTAAVTGATCSIAINSTYFPSPFSGVVTVKVSNGTFSASASSNTFTLGVVPAAPATATIAATGAKLVPTWSMTSTTGVLGYSLQLATCSSTIVATATCTATGSPVFVSAKNADGSDRTTYSTGFTMAGGAIYTIQVSAVNAAGTGAALNGTDSSAYETYGAQVPSAPVTTVNSVTNGAITFTFTAPTYNNGSPIVGYTYQAYSVDNGALVGTAKSVLVPGQYTISGLGANGTYAVSVVALNGQGSSTSTYSAGANGNSKPVLVGGAATSLTATYTATGVTFKWTAPAASSTITTTEATYNVVDAGTILCSATAPALTCDAPGATIQALLAKSLASANVYAVDANGAQNILSNTVTLAAPGKPTSVTIYTDATTGNNIEVTWTNSADATKSAATSFIITSTTSKGVQQTWTAASTATSYVIPASSLTATQTETFQVSAVNGAGSTASDASVAAASATPVGLPTAPVTVVSAAFTAAARTYAAAVTALLTPVVNAGGNFVTVVWLANTTEVTGNTVSSFTATLTEASGTVLTCTSTPTQALLASNAALAFLSPSPQNAVNAAWAAMGDNGTASVYGCTFAGVPANASYTYTVVANGAVSSSLSTATLASGTANTSSGASSPTILSAVSSADGTQITVTFTVPSSNPSTLVGYLVTADDGAGNLYMKTSDTTNQNATVGKYVAPTLYSCLGAQVLGTTYSCTITVGSASLYGYETGTKFAIAVSTVDGLSGYTGITSGLALDVSKASTTTVTTNNVPVRPAAPTAVLAQSTTSAANVTVSYTAPSVVPSSNITKYTVSFTDAGSAQTETLAACSLGTVTSTYATVALVTVSSVNKGCEVTLATAGLGKVYPVTMSFATPEATVFSVTAATAAGYSVSSPVSGAVVPTLVTAQPDAYVNGSVTAGYVLGWAPVAYATSYAITVTGGTSPISYTTTSTNFTVPASALSAGDTYSFYVTAVNAGGSSDGTNAAGAAYAPTAPTNFVVFNNAAVPTSQTFTWSAPTTATSASANSLPMTYTVQATISGVVTTVASGLTTTSWTTAYNALATAYAVYAVNNVGLGAGAGPVAYTFTAAAAPTAPTTPVVSSVSSSAATLGWSQGTLGTNVPLVTYTASLTSPSGTVVSCPTSTVATASCIFSGLSAYTTYTYSVTETTGAGTSTALTGTFQTLGTAPGTPVITALTESDTLVSTTYYHNVTVTWTAPASAGSSAITGYVLRLDTHNATTGAVTSSTYCATMLTASSTTCTITGLNGGTYYFPVLVATNAAGSSAVPATTVAGTSNDYNNAVTYVKTTADSAVPGAFKLVANTYTGKAIVTYPAYGSVSLSWIAASDNAAPVTSYTCTATATGYATVTVSVTAPASSCTLTGLSNVSYTIVVNAVNAVGTTTATGTNDALGTAVVTNKWVNNTPVNFAAVSAVGGTVTAAFPVAPAVVPGSENSAPITSYIVNATAADGTVLTKTCAAPATSCTISGAVAGAKYTVTVQSVTAAGNSTVVASNTVTALASTNPAAVTAVTAVRNVNGLQISWTAPASLGSAAQLVGYWVTATDPLTLQQYSCPYNTTYGVILAPAVTCNIAGLTVGNTYTVSITAIGVDGNMTKLLSAATTITAAYNTLAPKPVIVTFNAVTAKQKSVSSISPTGKAGLTSLISNVNDGAEITISGYGTTKAIALARANATASYLFNNGAAVHVTIKTVVSKTVKTVLVTVTKN